MKKHFTITPLVIAKGFSFVVIALLAANLLFLFLEHILKLRFHSIQIFYFNKEGNIPTVYSSFAILVAAVLLWLIGGMESEKGLKSYWKFLSFLFVFLAVDELVSIHEAISDNTQDLLGNYATGALHFAWVIPYVAVFGIVFAFMVRFLYLLPATTRRLFLVAGFIFVFGAVGFEMIGGKFVYFHGEESKYELTYALIVTVEEFLEMIAIVIFIYALSSYYIGHTSSKSILLSAELTDQKQKVASFQPDKVF